MKEPLVLATVFLVVFVPFGCLAEPFCSIRLYRSPDQSAIKVLVNDNYEYLYLSLEDNPTFPAIQFYVKGQQVVVFDKQARAEKTTINILQNLWDMASVQFQYIYRQFIAIASGTKLRGRWMIQNPMFRAGKFQVEWQLQNRYLITLADVPNFSIAFKGSPGQKFYEIKSPMFDLMTRIDQFCKVRIYRHGVEVDQVRLFPIERRPRSSQDWNPMDPNSWTLFDDRLRASSFGTNQDQARPSSTSGFRFARPLSPSEPSEPEDPDELDLL